MSEKELTFVMPTYNSASYLKRTLKSVKKMIGNYGDKVEVLFVDDGSTDETAEILKKEIHHNSNYRFLAAEHGGVSRARNIGIKNAQGKYITFIDSDDLYAPDFVLHFLKQIKQEPDIVWEDVQNLNDSTYRKIKTDSERIKLMQMVLGITDVHIQEGIASKFYRRKFLLENKILFDEEIVISEDTLFILEAIDKAKSIYLSNFKFYMILAEHSLSRFNEKVLKSELEYEEKIDALFKNFDATQVKLILARIKINGICTLVRRYYGAKIIRNELSIREASRNLSSTIDEYYAPFISLKKGARSLPKRYRLLHMFLRHKLYYLMFCFDVFIDKLKKVSWE